MTGPVFVGQVTTGWLTECLTCRRFWQDSKLMMARNFAYRVSLPRRRRSGCSRCWAARSVVVTRDATDSEHPQFRWNNSQGDTILGVQIFRRANPFRGSGFVLGDVSWVWRREALLNLCLASEDNHVPAKSFCTFEVERYSRVPSDVLEFGARRAGVDQEAATVPVEPHWVRLRCSVAAHRCKPNH